MRAKRSKPAGQVRMGQAIGTCGPGAMIDLPRKAGIIAGLEFWRGVEQEIHEPRLVEKLRAQFPGPGLRLMAPPAAEEDGSTTNGIRVWLFPEWFVSQEMVRDAHGVRTRFLVNVWGLTEGKFLHERKKLDVVPIRFVRACLRGHIGDVDWRWFVHTGGERCRSHLLLQELGTSEDLNATRVRCPECGSSRSLGEAATQKANVLGMCDGNSPWLGRNIRADCGLPNRLLARAASNAYFAQTLTVISLPDPDETIAQAVGQVWESDLQFVDDLEDLQRDRRKKARVGEALQGLRDEDVLKAIQTRRNPESSGPPKSVKQAELEVLTGSQDEVGKDVPEGSFYARNLPRWHWDQPWMKDIAQVILVHRLRQVTAQIGFTRFEAHAPTVEGELEQGLEVGVEVAPLVQEPKWLPAVENRGEGFFLLLRREAVEKWLGREQVKARERQLRAGFAHWKAAHPSSRRQFPGAAFVLLHSLSHLLIQAVSLECGYPATSVRERIYALPEVGYGILLMTSTPDAEGTLGGLVEAGRKVARHLCKALDLARLCSNDPVCSQHNPAVGHDGRSLLGAACHGCLLVAEPCCEWMNDYLDRALVVPTVDALGAEFFPTGRS